MLCDAVELREHAGRSRASAAAVARGAADGADAAVAVAVAVAGDAGGGRGGRCAAEVDEEGGGKQEEQGLEPLRSRCCLVSPPLRLWYGWQMGVTTWTCEWCTCSLVAAAGMSAAATQAPSSFKPKFI